MPDCTKAKGLIDWIYWTQTNAAAIDLASKCRCSLPPSTSLVKCHLTEPTLGRTLLRNYLGVAGQSAPLRARLMDFVASMTCDGEHVSSVYGCIYQGTLCSDHGVCSQTSASNGRCICTTGYEGEHCETAISNSSSNVPLAAILGSIIPAALIALLVMCCIIVGLLVWARRARRREDDWEVDMGELEVGEQLGAGGYGEVHRAVWKGTEVAVKVWPRRTPGRDWKELQGRGTSAPHHHLSIASRVIRNRFTRAKCTCGEQVRVMTALRHPNVVLFMAACTKAPKMCIVMEYMALGSLFDVRSSTHAIDSVH